MVFGKPDVDIRSTGDEPEVEVRGVDVYDPTTGEVRSGPTYDIACWFLDSNYDGESFLVRHAHFTGGNDPFAQLRRALRADINEDAWASIDSTVSRPFPSPETGKIAVKAINHYGVALPGENVRADRLLQDRDDLSLRSSSRHRRISDLMAIAVRSARTPPCFVACKRAKAGSNSARRTRLAQRRARALPIQGCVALRHAIGPYGSTYGFRRAISVP
jgi:hypothetical protein